MTNEQLLAIEADRAERYDEEIDALSKANGHRNGFTKRQVEDLKAGFRDGARNMRIAILAGIEAGKL